MQEKQWKKRILQILYLLGVLLSGVLVATIIAAINGMRLGFYTWPIVLCVDVFLFSTVGFFSTTGSKEVLYGVCSILSIACGIVQMAILF